MVIKTAITVMAMAAVFCGQAKSGDSTVAGGRPVPRQAVTGKKAVDNTPQAKPSIVSPVKKPEKAPDTLVITGRLIEIPGEMPPNDHDNYVYIMKYRVMEIQKGAYDGPEILVGVYNPLVPRRRITDAMGRNAKGEVVKFRVGDMHRLSLVAPMDKVWNRDVEDEYLDSDLTRYYAVRVDMVR